MQPPLIVLVMGVSGSGKTTIATGVAARLQCDLLEGDKLHPAANVEKMRRGQPLDDEDRLPWLRAIAAEIEAHIAAGVSLVVACSALKRSYRAILAGSRTSVALVYLQGSIDLIRERMARRRGHFMPPSLLDSQFATLQEPEADEDPIVVHIGPPPDAIVAAVLAALHERGLVQQGSMP